MPKTQSPEQSSSEAVAVPDSEELSLTIFKPKTSLRNLPPQIQKAIERAHTREKAGFAKQWKPQNVDDFFIGQVASVRDDVETEFGTALVVTFNLPNAQQLAVFCSADLRSKLQGAQVGQVYCVQYQGMQSKKDNPKLKGDMKIYSVVEVMPED